MNSSRDELCKTYDLWKERPNLQIDPSSFNMNLTRNTFNAKYSKQGHKNLRDSYLSMALKMPKAYTKSLESEVRTARVFKVSE